MIPKGIVTTSWPKVEAKLLELGVRFDAWQDGAGRIVLGRRADGSFAATVGGVVLSIPRQVGKTFFVGMIVVALCLIHPGLTVVWTAHRTRTATKTFQTLKGMTSRPRVKPHMLEPRSANGEQEIRFRNGSVIMFGAREQGFGRGFDQVDIAVFDEAQILSEKGVEDIVPAANQATLDGGALLFYMGTPPRPSDPGEEFTNRRTLALSGRSEDMVYVEFSADEDADLDDVKQWAKANPSYPARTPIASMKRMRANLTDDDSFRREALGIWPDPDADDLVIPQASWLACSDTKSVITGQLAFGVDVAPDGERAAICVAGFRADGLVHLEHVDSGPGTAWVAARVAELRKLAPVAIDDGGPAGALLVQLEALGVTPEKIKARELAQTCGRLLNLVESRELRHRDEGVLLEAVLGAKTRPVGEAWAWARKKATSDITPLYAATLALWALSTTPRQLTDDELLASAY